MILRSSCRYDSIADHLRLFGGFEFRFNPPQAAHLFINDKRLIFPHFVNKCITSWVSDVGMCRLTAVASFLFQNNTQTCGFISSLKIISEFTTSFTYKSHHPKAKMSLTNLIVKGAKEHNLKNIDVTLPRDKLIVNTYNRVRIPLLALYHIRLYIGLR